MSVAVLDPLWESRAVWINGQCRWHFLGVSESDTPYRKRSMYHCMPLGQAQMEWNLGSTDDVGFYIHSQGSLVLETLEVS